MASISVRHFLNLLIPLLCWLRLPWPQGRLHGFLSWLGFLAMIGLVACDSDSTPAPTSYGPLSVVEGTGGDEARGGRGPIRIGDECVNLTIENGQELLLVWYVHEEGWQVAWNDEDRLIAFTSPGESAISIRDGDIVTVGGSSLIGDSPATPNLNWLVPPNESCSGEPWGVSSVTIES
jgi:hypothetical protein